MLDRLNAYYQDKGIRPDVLDAVLSIKPTRPMDIDQRLNAVAQFKTLDAAESLAAANKRIGNILKKIEGTLPTSIDESLLQEDAEKALFAELNKCSDSVESAIKQADYNKALNELAGLRDSVDGFFDNVMVMTDDRKLKDNRIALLNKLHGLFMQVADISRLQN